MIRSDLGTNRLTFLALSSASPNSPKVPGAIVRSESLTELSMVEGIIYICVPFARYILLLEGCVCIVPNRTPEHAGRAKCDGGNRGKLPKVGEG